MKVLYFEAVFRLYGWIKVGPVRRGTKITEERKVNFLL